MYTESLKQHVLCSVNTLSWGGGGVGVVVPMSLAITSIHIIIQLSCTVRIPIF